MSKRKGLPKNNSRKTGYAAGQKTRRATEAIVRNEEYSKLTTAQKLAKLDTGKFAAKKQRARLVGVTNV